MARPMKFLGTVLYVGSGIATFIFWLVALSSWMGEWGIFVAIIVAPGLVIFPIIYWIVEGVFPVLYFVIWGIGVLGIIISSASGRSDE